MMIPNKRLLSIGIGLGVLIFATQLHHLSSLNRSNSARIVSNGIGMNGIAMNGIGFNEEAINQFSDSPADYLDPSQVQATLDKQTEGTISIQNGQLVFRVSK